ncbi:MAG: PIN domain-containing protein [Candidatus Eremiobacterota bacterium]
MTGEPVGLDVHLRALTCSRLVAPKLWQDAYLAAFARASGLRLATFDKDFRQFPDFEVTLLTPSRG